MNSTRLALNNSINQQPIDQMKSVVFVSSDSKTSAPIILALENCGFTVRYCKNANEAIYVFRSPAGQKPTLLIVDSYLLNPHLDLSEVQLMDDSPVCGLGIKLFKYLRIFNPELRVIICTTDSYEQVELSSSQVEKGKLKVLLCGSHLQSDILRAVTRQFPEKTQKSLGNLRDTSTVEHYKVKAKKRRVQFANI